MSLASQLGEDKPFLEILPDVIKSYGMSMMYGHCHTSQSLPRMLTLWFDFGTFLQTFRAGKGGQVSMGVGAARRLRRCRRNRGGERPCTVLWLGRVPAVLPLASACNPASTHPSASPPAAPRRPPRHATPDTQAPRPEEKQAVAAAAASICAVMGGLAKHVPMHTWLAALPQLISRMCHPCKEVCELAKQIIVRITQVGRMVGRMVGWGQVEEGRVCVRGVEGGGGAGGWRGPLGCDQEGCCASESSYVGHPAALPCWGPPHPTPHTHHL